jgi:NADH-quinone oxidoreductase subunit J
MALFDVLFYLLAAMTGICAVAVVVTQNIVRAAAWLLFTLAGVSGLFFLLGADFVGATQLLVYVGGTLVLVVFGVMLTAQSPFINMRISAAEWGIALAVGLVLYGVLAASLVISTPKEAVPAVASSAEPQGQQQGLSPRWGWRQFGAPRRLNAEDMPDSTLLGQALLGQWQASPQGIMSGLPADIAPRRHFAVSYLLPFEIVSVHLLVVLIGAAYLARAKRRRLPATPGREQQLGARA